MNGPPPRSDSDARPSPIKRQRDEGKSSDASSSPVDGAIKVMIVDDSLTVRTIFKRMVESDREMEVVETASSAERAIAQLKATRVDVILLDLEMPGMGGLEALPEILKQAQGGQVLVVSSLTQDGAEHSVSALSMGAADTMLKPRPGGFNEEYRSQLLDKIRALGQGVDEPSEQHPAGDVAHESETSVAATSPAPAPTSSASRPAPGKRPEVIAIGASTGGIHALNIMLRRLAPEFDLPLNWPARAPR